MGNPGTMTQADIQKYVDYNELSMMFCRTRKNPIFLAGVFMEIIKGFYADPSNLYPNVMKFDPDGKCPDSLYINISGEFDDNKVDMRPALIIDIGDLVYSTDKVQGLDGTAGYNLKEGETLFNRLVTGSVVFAHLAKTPGEAQLYASNTLDLVDAFAYIIKNDFCFDKFNTQGIFKPRLRKEEPRDFECLVQADFMFQESFSVKHESPKLKQVAFKALAGIAQTFLTTK